MTKRLIALVGPCLLAMIAVACGDEGFDASPDAPRTSEPTVPPMRTPETGELRTGESEFPLHLDPELTDVRPEDDLIFAGWTNYLANTAVVHQGWETELHLYSNGVVMIDGGLHENFTNW